MKDSLARNANQIMSDILSNASQAYRKKRF
jgi:hypothetical protein